MANEKFQNALRGKTQQIPPVWFMRQAGRYHKHYQNLRSKHSFMDLCKVPELAAETAMGPIRDFDFDVAILFSDLLFPLEALGFGLSYEDTGPKLGVQLSQELFPKLKTVEEAAQFMQFQKKALQCTREVLPSHKSLIGFVGGPWTLFSYACQGTHAGGLVETKRRMSLYGDFCKVMLPLLKANIQLQLEGGAEVVMIFDTASGELNADIFGSLVAPSLSDLAKAFPGKVAYYSKGTVIDHLLPLKSDHWAGMGYDHRWNLAKLLRESTQSGFVQGNFDQYLLFLDRSDFERELKLYLDRILELPVQQRSRWVSGLGHGVLPKTPEDHVRILVDTIRKRCEKAG